MIWVSIIVVAAIENSQDMPSITVMLYCLYAGQDKNCQPCDRRDWHEHLCVSPSCTEYERRSALCSRIDLWKQIELSEFLIFRFVSIFVQRYIIKTRLSACASARTLFSLGHWATPCSFDKSFKIWTHCRFSLGLGIHLVCNVDGRSDAATIECRGAYSVSSRSL